VFEMFTGRAHGKNWLSGAEHDRPDVKVQVLLTSEGCKIGDENKTHMDNSGCREDRGLLRKGLKPW
jgi:hypothetical protein